MNEETTTGGMPEFEKKPIQESAPKGSKILVTLDRYEALVGLVEALFNIVNDRTPLGTMGNDLMQKIGAIKKEINEAKN